MEKIFLFFVACVTLVIVAVLAAGIGGGIRATQVQSAFSGAEKAYLFERFNHAYKQESAVVAIWEGTNLVTFLIEKSGASSAIANQEIASQAILNARISYLYEEIGNSSKAREFAKASKVLYDSVLSKPTSMTPEEVVTNLVGRDHPARQIP